MVKIMKQITISGERVGATYSLYCYKSVENPRNGKKYEPNYRFWDTAFYTIN